MHIDYSKINIENINELSRYLNLRKQFIEEQLNEISNHYAIDFTELFNKITNLYNQILNLAQLEFRNDFNNICSYIIQEESQIFTNYANSVPKNNTRLIIISMFIKECLQDIVNQYANSSFITQRLYFLFCLFYDNIWIRKRSD